MYYEHIFPQIRYWKAGDKEAAADRVRSPSLDLSAKVSGLKPNTLYHVTVRAYNRAGTGPPSPIANVTTSKARKCIIGRDVKSEQLKLVIHI